MTGPGQKLLVALVVLFLAAPLIVVAGVSLNVEKQLLFPPHGLSLTWYADLFREPDWLNAVKNSLIIALLSAAAFVIWTTPA